MKLPQCVENPEAGQSRIWLYVPARTSTSGGLLYQLLRLSTNDSSKAGGPFVNVAIGTGVNVSVETVGMCVAVVGITAVGNAVDVRSSGGAGIRSPVQEPRESPAITIAPITTREMVMFILRILWAWRLDDDARIVLHDDRTRGCRNVDHGFVEAPICTDPPAIGEGLRFGFVNSCHDPAQLF